ncbi:hypothetical protein HF326_00770 [Bacillus altitudinis MN12]|nr:hypothetical protein [Bacillus altitudinis MN12]
MNILSRKKNLRTLTIGRFKCHTMGVHFYVVFFVSLLLFNDSHHVGKIDLVNG